ncbi:MAG TPA: hypothetical protein VJM33_07800 [Microthrixaceae bacterium]|nr:hypothetical protein [Microthrixaceae bacterium]
MRVKRGDRIGALDAVETRSRVRHLPISESITAVLVSERLGITETEAQDWIAQLLALGLLHETDGFVGRTADANRLASATIGAGFIRANALRVLRDFDSRIERVASERPHRIGIDEVIVFGSILDRDQDRVGDVDVAVSLGLPSSNFTLTGVFDTYKVLQGRSRTISIVELGPHREIVENGPHLVIWRRGVRVADVSDLH